MAVELANDDQPNTDTLVLAHVSQGVLPMSEVNHQKLAFMNQLPAQSKTISFI